MTRPASVTLLAGLQVVVVLCALAVSGATIALFALLSSTPGDRVWIEQVGTSTRCVVTPDGLDTTSSSAHCGSGWVLDPVPLIDPPAVNGPALGEAARVEDTGGSLVLVYPGQDGDVRVPIDR